LDYRKTPYEVFNLGSGRRITLAQLVKTLEQITGKAALLECLPAQAADMPETWADIAKAQSFLGYQSRTDLSAGLRDFVQQAGE
jgi:nucleoside-diphosphate-sugar epimerase